MFHHSDIDLLCSDVFNLAYYQYGVGSCGHIGIYRCWNLYNDVFLKEIGIEILSKFTTEVMNEIDIPQSYCVYFIFASCC